MQLVERDLVELDEGITNSLPGWKCPQILVGFDGKENGEKPRLIQARNRIMLR